MIKEDWYLCLFFLFRAELDRQWANNPKAEDEQPKTQECLPRDIFMPIELDDKFSNHKDNSRADHSMESEPMGFKILDKAPEQLNDDQKGENIRYRSV